MLPDITLDCKKQCLFYTWGHRPMNRSIIIFNLSFFTHSHYFWNRTEFSTSSTNTCPVRISNTTSSLAVSVTKRNSLVLFHFSFITESEQKKKTNIPSHLSTEPALSFAYVQSRVLRNKYGKLMIMLTGFPDISNSNTPTFFPSYFHSPCIYCSVKSIILRSCLAYQAKY